MSIKAWIPEGKAEEFVVTVSGKRQTLYAAPYRWFSADIYNEGPDDVRVMVNTQSPTKAIKLSQDQARDFTFDAPKIERIDLENNSGQTSTVRVTAMR